MLTLSLLGDRLRDLCRLELDQFVREKGTDSLPLSYDESLAELEEIAVRNLQAGRLERQNRFRDASHQLTLAQYLDRLIVLWSAERMRWLVLKQRDAAAWEWLTQDLRHAAARFLKQRPPAGSCASTPEDFVQLACLQIARADYRFDVPLLIWARAILKNTVRTPDRSHDVLDLWHFSLDETPTVGENKIAGLAEYADPKADGYFASVAESEALFGAMAQLTSLRQAILILTYFEERTDAEIGKTLRISMTHLHSTRHRALKQLATLLRDSELQE